jgi:hypothetical protein
MQFALFLERKFSRVQKTAQAAVAGFRRNRTEARGTREHTHPPPALARPVATSQGTLHGRGPRPVSEAHGVPPTTGMRDVSHPRRSETRKCPALRRLTVSKGHVQPCREGPSPSPATGSVEEGKLMLGHAAGRQYCLAPLPLHLTPCKRSRWGRRSTLRTIRTCMATLHNNTSVMSP